MSLNTIRTFRIADQAYRHAMCEDDHVFLQRYQDNAEATCDDDLWVTLLKYDRNCDVWAAEGVKVGNFRLEGTAEQWVFYENPLRTRIEFPPNRGPEALLDAEVHYSRRWLARKRSSMPRCTTRAAGWPTRQWTRSSSRTRSPSPQRTPCSCRSTSSRKARRS